MKRLERRAHACPSGRRVAGANDFRGRELITNLLLGAVFPGFHEGFRPGVASRVAIFMGFQG